MVRQDEFDQFSSSSNADKEDDDGNDKNKDNKDNKDTKDIKKDDKDIKKDFWDIKKDNWDIKKDDKDIKKDDKDTKKDDDDGDVFGYRLLGNPKIAREELMVRKLKLEQLLEEKCKQIRDIETFSLSSSDSYSELDSEDEAIQEESDTDVSSSDYCVVNLPDCFKFDSLDLG